MNGLFLVMKSTEFGPDIAISPEPREWERATRIRGTILRCNGMKSSLSRSTAVGYPADYYLKPVAVRPEETPAPFLSDRFPERDQCAMCPNVDEVRHMHMYGGRRICDACSKQIDREDARMRAEAI